MKVPFASRVIPVALAVCAAASGAASAQTSKQPLFTQEAPWLCVGGSFVAMVPLGPPNGETLFVIPIDNNGIEPLQKIAITSDEVFGLQCLGSYIEVLELETRSSDYFSILRFTVDGNTVTPQIREGTKYPARPGHNPNPPEAERAEDAFDSVGSRSGIGIWGDWSVIVLRTNNIHHTYEVHYIRTKKPSGQALEITDSVSLVEETLDGRITQTVPLVRVTDYDTAPEP